MKIYSWIFAAFTAFVSFIAILYVVVIPVAFDKSFYYKQFEINKSYEEANVSKEQLNLVIDHVIDYLKDNNDDLQITITLNNGSTRNAFTRREIAHLVDVKNLFINGRIIGRVAIGLSILSLSILFIRPKWFSIKTVNYIKYVIFGIIAFFGMYGLFLIIDFDNAFRLFHKIFFTNDLWILNYDDLFLIMYPESVFLLIGFRILILFFTGLLIYLLLLNSYERRLNIKNKLQMQIPSI